jgi:hypothetical protein
MCAREHNLVVGSFYKNLYVGLSAYTRLPISFLSLYCSSGSTSSTSGNEEKNSTKKMSEVG